MGPIVLPEIFLGLVAIRPVPTVEGEVTCIPPCIPPRASASVLGTVNAIASAIVVNFIIVSVVVSEETTAPPVLCFLNSFLRAMEALILIAENNGPTIASGHVSIESEGVDGSDEMEDVQALQILLQSIKILAEKGLGRLEYPWNIRA